MNFISPGLYNGLIPFKQSNSSDYYSTLLFAPGEPGLRVGLNNSCSIFQF
jgi:hypothetical protein